jgi:hypothetical protein
VAAGYYPDADLLIEGVYSRGLASAYFIKLRSDILEARARWFLGNSFYGSLGIGRRTISADFDLSSVLGSSAFDVGATVNELTVNGGLGSEWQWQTVTFGVDWLGVRLPLRRLGTSDTFPDTAVTPEARRIKAATFDRIAGGPSFSLLGFSLGAAW